MPETEIEGGADDSEEIRPESEDSTSVRARASPRRSEMEGRDEWDLVDAWFRLRWVPVVEGAGATTAGAVGEVADAREVMDLVIPTPLVNVVVVVVGEKGSGAWVPLDVGVEEASGWLRRTISSSSSSSFSSGT